jgi:hypothetical protein
VNSRDGKSGTGRLHSGSPDSLPRLSAITALCVAAAKPRRAPDGAQCHFDFGKIGQDGRASHTLVAEHLPAAGVEKIYDLTFDCHRRGMQSLLQRRIERPLRKSL